MRRRLFLVLVLGMVGLLFGVSWSRPGTRARQPEGRATPAQPTPESVLPIRQVVLFSSGVGFFQRAGDVQDTAHLDLAFPAEQVNDLLKSLVLQDLDGGTISTVSYDSEEPVEKTMHSFALDLNGNPTFGELLNQARGERIEVTCAPRSGFEPNPCSGVIVGMEARTETGGKQVDQLNLLCSDGLRGVPLAKVQSVRFLNPTVQKDFDKALRLLGSTHGARTKLVSLTFQGQGKRRVQVGYVVENPIWKASYRLVLRGKETFLQGWAIVDNPSHEDWTNVRLALVSGRPISFEMNLYQPLYVPRPTVEPELFASLRPPVHEVDMDEDDGPPGRGGMLGAGGLGGMGGLGFGGGVGIGGLGMGVTGGSPALGGLQPVPSGNRYQVPHGNRPKEQNDRLTYQELLDRQQGKDDGDKAGKPTVIDPRQGVIAAADAHRVGTSFQYAIAHPVSLPRQKSALIPIVQQPIAATPVSIFNAGVQAQFPMFGLRFKNTTGLNLMQGPVTIFTESSYAGDAQLPDLKPNDERLVSYALDTGIEVQVENAPEVGQITAIKIVKGMVTTNSRLHRTTTYRIKSRTDQERTLLLEHPYQSGWQLVEPHAVERSRDVYRLLIPLPARRAIVQRVTVEKVRQEQYTLASTDVDTVSMLLRQEASSPQLKEALHQAFTLRAQWLGAQHAVRRHVDRLTELRSDEARIRANIQALPSRSASEQRAIDKLDVLERDIDATEKQLKDARTVLAQRHKAYEDYLAGLTIDGTAPAKPSHARAPRKKG